LRAGVIRPCRLNHVVKKAVNDSFQRRILRIPSELGRSLAVFIHRLFTVHPARFINCAWHIGVFVRGQDADAEMMGIKTSSLDGNNDAEFDVLLNQDRDGPIDNL